MFSEHLGYVVSGLSLTLESSWMYLSCPILSSPAGIPITYMGLRSSIVLFTLFFFFVFFSLGHFYLPVFTFNCFFPQLCVKSIDEPSSSVLPYFKILVFLFDFLVSNSLMKFSICLCILFNFSTKVFGIFIITTLNSLSESFNIWVRSESGYLDYFVS